MQEPIVSCPHCHHQFRLELTISPKPTATEGECHFGLRLQPASGGIDTKPTRGTSFVESSKNLVAHFKIGSIPAMPQSIKNAISIPLKGAKFDPSLFNEHSEKSKSRSSAIKPSKNSDHSMGTISKNFDKTREEPMSPSKKDFKFVEPTRPKLSEIIARVVAKHKNTSS